MIGSESEDGIASFLANSVTVWDGMRLSGFQRSQRSAFTFFYSVRSASFFRFYFWGQITGLEISGPDAEGARDRVSVASADAEVEALPGSGVDEGFQAYYTVPNTEEFLVFDAPMFPLRLADVAFVTSSNTAPPTILATDEDGKLYACGSQQIRHASQYPANPLGLGPRQTALGSLTSLTYSPVSQPTLQRVYGDDDAFSSVAFTKVCICEDYTTASRRCAGVAISSDGKLWMSGEVSGLAEAADFSENSTQLAYFRDREITQWYDSSGTLQSGSPLRFSMAVGGSATTGNSTPTTNNPRSLFLLEEDGRLFVLGRFLLGRVRTSSIPHEVGGFVDSVNILSAGTGYSANTRVTFSPPENAEGQAASGFLSFGIPLGQPQFAITGVNIINPGWGYSSPPTITLTNAGDGSGATFSCNLFSGTWKHVSANSTGASIAVSSDGVIYNWGINCVMPQVSDPIFLVDGVFINTRYAQSPRRANRNGVSQLAVYDRAYIGGSGRVGVAIDVDGHVSFIAYESDRLGPDLETHVTWTLLEDVSEFGQYVFIDAAVGVRGNVVALVRDDGSVYTYGLKGPFLAHGQESHDGQDGTGSRRIQKIVGSAVWKNVWSNTSENADGIIAARDFGDEDFLDQYGLLKNPLPPYEHPAP